MTMVDSDTSLDPTVEQGSLTEREMKIINCIKLKNKIRERADSVTDDGFDALVVSPKTLNEIKSLIVKLEAHLNELGYESEAQYCSETIQTISSNLDKVDDLESTRPVSEMSHSKFIKGLNVDIKYMYASWLRNVINEL